MRIRPLGTNQTELTVGEYTILFSYTTPVAYNKEGVGFFRTATTYSNTTTRHIDRWLDGVKAVKVDQLQIDLILSWFGGTK